MFKNNYPYTIVFACSICLVLIVYMYLFFNKHIEPFKCTSTFTHTFDSHTKKTTNSNDPLVVSSELSTLVSVKKGLSREDTPPKMHNNTVCEQNGAIDVHGLQAIPNGELKINDSVYVHMDLSQLKGYSKLKELSTHFFPATVVGIYNPGDIELIKLKNVSLEGHYGPQATPIQVQPNSQLFAEYYRKTSSYPAYIYSVQSVFQNPNKMKGSDIINDVSIQNKTDELAIAVVFDDALLQQSIMELYKHTSDTPYIFPLSRIKRLPSQNVVQQCAQNCVQTYPDTWGIQTGKCYPQGSKNGKPYSVCSCACIVPKEVYGQCTHEILQGDDLKNALQNNNVVDLHQINRNTVAQQQMLTRLEEKCKHTGYQKPVSFPCEDTQTEAETGESTDSSLTCCPSRCSAYTGQLRELCSNQTKLQTFLNKLPPIVSMGKAFCPTTASTSKTKKLRCKKNEDIPCPSRVESQCTTYNHPTNNYKCAWHKHNPDLEGDIFATGCYNQDDCIVQNETKCKENKHTCKWTKNKICVDASYCPYSCPSLKTRKECKDNPFCRFNGVQCKKKNVMDMTEFKAQYMKPVKTTTSLNTDTVFSKNITQNIHFKTLIDLWNQEKKKDKRFEMKQIDSFLEKHSYIIGLLELFGFSKEIFVRELTLQLQDGVLLT